MPRPWSLRADLLRFAPEGKLGEELKGKWPCGLLVLRTLGIAAARGQTHRWNTCSVLHLAGDWEILHLAGRSYTWLVTGRSYT